MDVPKDVLRRIESMLGPSFEILEIRLVHVNMFEGKALHRKKGRVYYFRFYPFSAEARGPLLELIK